VTSELIDQALKTAPLSSNKVSKLLNKMTDAKDEMTYHPLQIIDDDGNTSAVLVMSGQSDVCTNLCNITSGHELDEETEKEDEKKGDESKKVGTREIQNENEGETTEIMIEKVEYILEEAHYLESDLSNNVESLNPEISEKENSEEFVEINEVNHEAIKKTAELANEVTVEISAMATDELTSEVTSEVTGDVEVELLKNEEELEVGDSEYRDMEEELDMEIVALVTSEEESDEEEMLLQEKNDEEVKMHPTDGDDEKLTDNSDQNDVVTVSLVQVYHLNESYHDIPDSVKYRIAEQPRTSSLSESEKDYINQGKSFHARKARRHRLRRYQEDISARGMSDALKAMELSSSSIIERQIKFYTKQVGKAY